jgi:RNA polymerase sigma factor (sigma-70 family)
LSNPTSSNTALAPPQLAADFAICVSAFEDEFDFVHNSLRRHGVSEADAEDLVQEVFLVMWRRWSQYDRARPVRPWLAGIAFRVAYNHRQRVGREVPGGLIDREDDTPDPEQRLATDSARSMVRHVLDTMPEKQRVLILSHDVEGISVREIAEQLEVPIPTAHTRLRAARKTFAKTWKRLLAVSATRARIAPLLVRAGLQNGGEAPPVDAAALARIEAKQRASARARAIFPFLSLSPSALSTATSTSPMAHGSTAGSGVSPAPRLLRRREASSPTGPTQFPVLPVGGSLWKAWVPVAASIVIGGACLLSMLGRGRSSGAPSSAPAALTTNPAPEPTPTHRVLAGALAARRGLLTSMIARRPSQQPGLTGSAGDRGSSLGHGLIGYWRFDDGAGSSWARDWSGNGNDCRLRQLDPALAWSEGRLGGGLTLNGQGWLECPHVEAVAGLDAQLTLSMWVRRAPSKYKVHALVSRQHGDGTLDAFHLGFRNDELALRSQVKGGPAFTAFPRVTGQWHHIAATLDTDGYARLYIDGELVRKKQKAGRPSLGGGNNPLIIGGGINGPDWNDVQERFSGAIDELSVYDRPLRPEEIRSLAQGTQPPLSP